MSRYDPRPAPKSNAEVDPDIYTKGNMEAHIIADMLRIETIANEVRDFKETVKERLDKLENWIVGIVGITVTSLVAIIVSLLQ